MPGADVLVMQFCREDADCAVASIAMYLAIPYNEVLRAVVATDRKDEGRTGLTNEEMQKVAKRLGYNLRWYSAADPNFDPDETYGILVVEEHACVLRNGLVIEVNGSVWEYDTYILNEGKEAYGVLVATNTVPRY